MLVVAVAIALVRGQRTVPAPAPATERSVTSAPLGEAPVTLGSGTAPVPGPAETPPNAPNFGTPTLVVPQAEGTPEGRAAGDRFGTNDPALAALRAAKSDPSAAGTEALVKALAADDALLVIEAADGLVARRATQALPALAKIDIKRSTNIAPAVIEAMGRLSGMAAGADHTTAVDRLLALLAQEKARGAPESRANLLQIYEALGDTKDARAAPALEAELRSDAVPRAAKNVIVQALGNIGAPSSRPALLELRAALATPEREPFEEAIRVELIEAIDQTLRALP